MKPTIYIEELIRVLNDYNVERPIVFSNPNIGDKYSEMNGYIAASVKKYPERLAGF